MRIGEQSIYGQLEIYTDIRSRVCASLYWLHIKPKEILPHVNREVHKERNYETFDVS